MLRFSTTSALGVFVFLYLTIGATTFLPYTDIILGLSCILFLYKGVESRYCVYVTLVMSILFFSTLFYNESSLLQITSRICKILSMYTAFFAIHKYFRLAKDTKIISRLFYFYTILAIVIIADSVLFLFTGIAMWLPENYLGLRFSGPFFDSNFLALFYGVLFLFTFNNVNYPKYYSILYLSVICLALSWSAIIFCCISYCAYKIFTKSPGVNQCIIIVGYILLLLLIANHIDFIQESFLKICSWIFNIEDKLLLIKFRSLEWRFESQLVFFNANNIHTLLWGHGPHTILKYMEIDTHNSFIGYAFEMGLLNLCLLLGVVNFMGDSKSGKYLLRSSLFFFLMGLLLNVHYTVAYQLIFFLSYTRNQLEG